MFQQKNDSKEIVNPNKTRWKNGLLIIPIYSTTICPNGFTSAFETTTTCVFYNRSSNTRKIIEKDAETITFYTSTLMNLHLHFTKRFPIKKHQTQVVTVVAV